MPTMQYSLSDFTNKNADLRAGNTFSAYASGAGVPNAFITGARLTLNNIRVYSAQCYLDIVKGGGTGKTANLAQNSNVHSQTVALAEYIHSLAQAGAGTISFTVRASGGSTGNLINLRDNVSGLLEIDYFVPVSDFTLNKAELDAGDTITATITPAHASATHVLTWRFQTATKAYESVIALDTPQSVPFDTSLNIPIGWLDAIPDVVSGTAAVTLETKISGVPTGSITKYFVIKAGAGVLPTIGNLLAERIDNGVPSGWGIYVQGKSGVRLTVENALGAYGSAIASIKVSGGGYQGNASPYETGPINAVGDVVCTAEVTDTRGRKAAKTVTVTFVAYYVPQITDVDSVRCNQDGTLSSSGLYAKVTVNYAVASVAGKNVIHAMSFHSRPYTGGQYAQQASQVIASGGSKVIGGAYAANSSYVIKVILQDEFNTLEAIALLPTEKVLMHFRYGGRGVAFFKIAEIPDAVEIAADKEFYYKGQTLDERFGGVDTPSIWPVSKGGTGLDNVPGGSYLKGNGVGALVPRTPAQVLSDIGAAASIHNHDAFSITPGNFPSGTFSFMNAAGASGTLVAPASLQVFQPTANADAFMTFHVSGDYAVQFGLDGAANDIFVGGYSMGANKYKVLHYGNIGAMASQMKFNGLVTPLHLNNPGSAYSVIRFDNSQGTWHLGNSINDTGPANFGIGYSAGPVVWWDYLGYQYPQNSIYFGGAWTGNRGSWNAPIRGAITQVIDNSNNQHSVIVGVDASNARHYGIDLFDSTTARTMRLYAGGTYLEIVNGGIVNSSGILAEGGTYLQNKYLGISAKAADANLLDGVDLQYFVAFKGWINYPGVNADLVESYVSFSYANNAPWIGPLVHFNPNGYGLMFSASYNIAGKLSFRTRNGDAAAYQPWNEIYHTGNIRNGQAGPGAGAEGDIYLQW